MKYSKKANMINFTFIALFFSLPILFALNNINLPMETGRFLILLSFILVALAILDWYGLYLSNTLKNILYNIGLFAIVSFICVLAVSVLSGKNFKELAYLQYALWEAYPLGLKIYVTSIGLVLISILSIPRWLTLKLLKEDDLPTSGTF